MNVVNEFRRCIINQFAENRFYTIMMYLGDKFGMFRDL